MARTSVFLPHIHHYTQTAAAHSLPALSLLLNRGRFQKREQLPVEQDLVQLLLGQIPAAALYWHVAGLTEPPVWLARLTPVHVAPTQMHLRVSNPQLIRLQAGDLQQLLPALNEVLEKTPIQAVLGMGKQLFLVSDEDQAIETTDLWQLAGENLLDCMPRGENEALWRAIFHNLQMETSHSLGALADPYDETRPNALWIWQAGLWPKGSPQGPWQTVVGEHPFLAAYAELCQANYHEDIQEYCQQTVPAQGNTLIIPPFPEGEEGENGKNPAPDLETDCLLPLINKIKAGHLQQLQLLIPSAQVDITSKSIRKFWCRTGSWPAWLNKE